MSGSIEVAQAALLPGGVARPEALPDFQAAKPMPLPEAKTPNASQPATPIEKLLPNGRRGGGVSTSSHGTGEKAPEFLPSPVKPQ